MIKPPTKSFSKTNHKLSFLLGVVFTILVGTIISSLVMWILKINPQDILLQLEEVATTSISEDQQEGIDISAINFSEDDYYLGQKDAQKVFVVYLDYQDVHSNRFYKTVKEFIETNQEDIKIVWRHFPLSFHDQAESAAIAAACAGEQGIFWQYSDYLFARQDNLSLETYLGIAQEMTINEEAFSSCLDSDISLNTEAAITTGISGTPNMIYIDQANDTYKYIGGYVNIDYLDSLLD